MLLILETSVHIMYRQNEWSLHTFTKNGTFFFIFFDLKVSAEDNSSVCANGQPENSGGKQTRVYTPDTEGKEHNKKNCIQGMRVYGQCGT